MRAIGTIQDGGDAVRFGDYLLTCGIHNSVDEARDGWIVWVRDEDRVDEARREFETFLEDPDDPSYARSADDARDIRRETCRADERRQRNIITPRDEWIAQTASLLSGRRKPGPLTLVLIIVCIGVAIATSLGHKHNAVRNALVFDPVTPKGHPVYEGRFHAILEGQVWRLVTPILLHFRFMHILFNMLWLHLFGAQIEGVKGVLKFAALVLVSAVISNVGQYLWSGPNFGGMSGVLYALFGYIWLKARLVPGDGLLIAPGTVGIMIFWLFFCMTGWIGPVGNVAHAAGLLVGMTWVYVPYRLRR